MVQRFASMVCASRIKSVYSFNLMIARLTFCWVGLGMVGKIDAVWPLFEGCYIFYFKKKVPMIGHHFFLSFKSIRLNKRQGREKLGSS